MAPPKRGIKLPSVARRGFGYLAIGVGAFMGLGIALNLVQADQAFGAPAYILALLFCTALPIGAGLSMLRGRSRGELALQAERAWEGELLRLAERKGGSLTLAEVVAHADLSRKEAEQRLDRLCQQGIAEYRISEGGVMVYRFAGFLSAGEKRQAEGVLDDG